jgi:hypothetical protein
MPADLREQYAAAAERCGFDVFDAGEVADAVLAIRDVELERATRQVAAVKAVTGWLMEVTRSPEPDPVRRDGTRRIVHMVNLALDDPDATLEYYQ